MQLLLGDHKCALFDFYEKKSKNNNTYVRRKTETLEHMKTPQYYTGAED